MERTPITKAISKRIFDKVEYLTGFAYLSTDEISELYWEDIKILVFLFDGNLISRRTYDEFYHIIDEIHDSENLRGEGVEIIKALV